MEIRPAREEDAPAICDVVRRSIVALCEADHRSDPEILELWLANKTPETVERWLANPNNINLVATEAGRIIAAGAVTVGGEIILNYVSPEARFRGVSLAMVAALEDGARQAGNSICRLDSTATAVRFYRRAGYSDAGPPGEKHGMPTYPMTKTL